DVHDRAGPVPPGVRPPAHRGQPGPRLLRRPRRAGRVPVRGLRAQPAQERPLMDARPGVSTRRLLLTSVALSLLGIALLGIPGALLMTPVIPRGIVVFGPGWMEANFTGDNAEWPFAIYLSLLWPFLLWPSYRLAARH